MNSFIKALASFQEQSARLESKGKATSAELRGIKSAGDALKSTVPSTRSALASIIEKLKVQRKWTAELDASVEDRIKKSPELDSQTRRGLLAALKEILGGARAAMEASLSQLSSASLGTEIDRDLKRFEASLVGSGHALDSLTQLVVFRPAAPDPSAAFKPNWKCAAGAGIFCAGIGAAISLGCPGCAVACA